MQTQDGATSAAQGEGHTVTKLPKGVILFKGAWSSASDSVTPLPEGGSIADHVYSNPYFGIRWRLPQDWYQQYSGPPPSDHGRYVLAQIVPSPAWKGPVRGSVLVTAEDLFFTPIPVSSAFQLIGFQSAHLGPYFRLDKAPMDVTLAGHPFRFFSYHAAGTDLRWDVFATDIRCHAVQFVVSSRDPHLLERLEASLNSMQIGPGSAFPSGTAGQTPVCLKDYARPENVIAQVSPVFYQPHYNQVPVRIIIGADGTVRHIHFLSAFPDQSAIISEALRQWKFKPLVRNGRALEVETGLLFGRSDTPGARSEGF